MQRHDDSPRESPVGRMNKWVFVWLLTALACLPAALITGGYNTFTVIGVGALALAGLVALYRPKEN